METKMIPVPRYEGLYSACSSGNIWSHRQRKYLKPWLIGHGYEMVMLYKYEKPEKILVHRLIATCFKANPDNLPEVNHISGERRDNKPENLEWVSSKQNKRHAISLGLYKNLGKNIPKGSKNPRSKLDEETVTSIRERVLNGESRRAIARELNVSSPLINSICKRRCWKHIP